MSKALLQYWMMKVSVLLVCYLIVEEEVEEEVELPLVHLEVEVDFPVGIQEEVQAVLQLGFLVELRVLLQMDLQ